MSKFLPVKICTNCESDDLRWYVGCKGPSDVADGRIRMSEVSPIAFLGCEECSQTLCIIYEYEINRLLNGEPVDE